MAAKDLSMRTPRRSIPTYTYACNIGLPNIRFPKGDGSEGGIIRICIMYDMPIDASETLCTFLSNICSGQYGNGAGTILGPEEHY